LDSNLEDIEIKISSVQSIFNYIFEKHFLLLQKININQYEALINYFIHKLSEKEISFYENYICILEDLLLNNNNLLPSLSSVCLNILTSNNRFLHKIAINILKKCLRNKEIDTVFLEYYISIYDSLDGYNSKIFKSLVSNLEYVINFINNYQNLKEKELDIQNLLTDPMNYLIILTRKIINNSNNKIKKEISLIQSSLTNISKSINIIFSKINFKYENQLNENNKIMTTDDPFKINKNTKSRFTRHIKTLKSHYGAIYKLIKLANGKFASCSADGALII
jgi:hypothetical protein